MRFAAWLNAVWQNRRGGVPRPAWCTWLVTYRCNARCGMCDSWRLPAGCELTPKEAGDVFRKIGRLDVLRISGGEPFVRRDLPELAEAALAASRPTVLHITTNGSLTGRVVDFVRGFSDPRRLRLMVSFDGLADEHDRNRGRGASFERALGTVRELAALRPALGLAVSANHTVISRQSLADSAGLRSELGRLAVELHTVLAYADSAMYGQGFQGRAAEPLILPGRYPLHPDLAGADVVGFVERELRATARLSPLLRAGKRFYLRGLLKRLRASDNGAALRRRPNGELNGRTPCSVPRCVALRSHIRVLPDGRVPVCQFNTQTVGDLRTATDLAEVWHGPAAAAARAWVDRCPGCWAECEVLPSAIYTATLRV